MTLAQAYPRSLRIVVRTIGDPSAAIAPMSEIVRRHDRDALVAYMETMTEIVDGSFTDFRRVVRHLGLFAGIALLLAAAACLVPALRATRVNPAVVLRSE